MCSDCDSWPAVFTHRMAPVLPVALQGPLVPLFPQQLSFLSVVRGIIPTGSPGHETKTVVAQEVPVSLLGIERQECMGGIRNTTGAKCIRLDNRQPMNVYAVGLRLSIMATQEYNNVVFIKVLYSSLIRMYSHSYIY